jgi:hypothetical protein
MTTETAVARPHLPTRRSGTALMTRALRGTTIVGFVVSGLLVAASGGIHLYLWDIAYRHVPTLGPLFLVQVVSAFVIAALLIAWRHGVVLCAALLLVVGTLIGFALVLTTGLFGFKLTFVSGWADLAVVVEGGAIVALVASAVLLVRERTQRG